MFFPTWLNEQHSISEPIHPSTIKHCSFEKNILKTYTKMDVPLYMLWLWTINVPCKPFLVRGISSITSVYTTSIFFTFWAANTNINVFVKYLTSSWVNGCGTWGPALPVECKVPHFTSSISHQILKCSFMHTPTSPARRADISDNQQIYK